MSITGSNFPTVINTYKKDEICSEETLKLYEGSENPNDILAMFGKHWWRRKKRLYEVVENPPSSGINFISLTAKWSNYGGEGATIYFADSFDVDASGKWVLNNPKIVKYTLTPTTDNKTTYTQGDNGVYYIHHLGGTNQNIPFPTADNNDVFTLTEKYFALAPTGQGTECIFICDYSTPPLWVSINTEHHSNLKIYYTAKVSINFAGYNNPEFISSINKNEYPNDVFEDDVYYSEYLGVPFENARQSMKIISGTYTGNGDSSRFIDLGVTPKVVIIGGCSDGIYDTNAWYYTAYYKSDLFLNDGNVENGFNVTVKTLTGNNNSQTKTIVGSNVSGNSYTYIAFI